MDHDLSLRLDEALRNAHAAHLPEASAALLDQRLAWGACVTSDGRGHNLGGLPDLAFGNATRKPTWRLEPRAVAALGGTTLEIQQAYLSGDVDLVPIAARPRAVKDRVKLFLDRQRTVALGSEAQGPTDEARAITGLGLATFASLGEAAAEAVRFALRAAPRAWPEVPEAWRASFDAYPTLTHESIPGFAELTAPLGWTPGRGPSVAAHETVRKLHADWMGFAHEEPRLPPEACEGWNAFFEDWSLGRILPNDLGGRLDAEIHRARNVRAVLAGNEPAEGVAAEPPSLLETVKAITFEKAMTVMTLGAMGLAYFSKNDGSAPKELPPSMSTPRVPPTRPDAPASAPTDPSAPPREGP